ncbi:hypothetical protein KJ359_009644 [Pestalotiopsis sp. 9143b]|nr:hypothetical protein KJ359_009644 [Pestalotiopsis sp. 9143b]
MPLSPDISPTVSSNFTRPSFLANIMTLFSFVLGLAMTASVTVTACPDHSNNKPINGKMRRAETNTTAMAWAYDESYDWGMLDPDYITCQIGTQQSPIALSQAANGLSSLHRPTFAYGSNTTGNLYNWGYGPAFTLTQSEDQDYTSLPSMTYDNQTVYLKGWHIHAPADHIIDGVRSHAELHFVHVDAAGHEKAVVGFPIDPIPSSPPSSSPSSPLDILEDAFFAQMPPAYHRWDETDLETETALDLADAVDAVARLDAFHTYEGSLTSPPCTEGLRWFVAARVLHVSVAQMQAILAASTYSARTEQMVWEHHINQ